LRLSAPPEGTSVLEGAIYNMAVGTAPNLLLARVLDLQVLAKLDGRADFNFM
jgi:hypothetical protein